MEHHSVQELGGGVAMFSGNVPMIIPSGGDHVRQAEIRVPRLTGNPPVVTATVFSNESPGTVFGVYHISVNPLGEATQIVISATNVEAKVGVPYLFWCNYIVIGTPALAS
jgi:hypothetical protein